MSDILNRIVTHKHREVSDLKAALPLDSFWGNLRTEPAFAFKATLTSSDEVNIIAEIKKGSPSKGIMLEDFDPVLLAQKYKRGGAMALSVLTDREFFFGDPEYVAAAKQESGLPVLWKDFIIDPYQIFYARYKGADAVLLITRLLSDQTLHEYIQIATDLGLDTLVEVHNEQELSRALTSGATTIGVNNRNLKDFSVSLETSERLALLIPDDIVKVAESGIFKRGDVVRLIKSGYINFLIGEALVTSFDPVKLLRSLRGK